MYSTTHHPDDFIWASGIEDTFVPQTRASHRSLDEYALIGHYEHWREDIALARDLGLNALRWGVPWYRVEPKRGKFDWSWTDEVIPFMVEEMGITPIIDLMHYGCPLWMRRQFASDDYPQAVAAYAKAFAERYKGLVHWYTPLNEPLVTALLCGRNGAWPPYLRGDEGYIRVMMQLCAGIQRTVEAIKAIDPDAVMVHVEAAGLSRATRQDLIALAVEEQQRNFLSLDLITGRVTPDHPLFTWLLRNGARPNDLAAMAHRRIPIDVMGLNFYPQWSTQQIFVNERGNIAYTATEQDGVGFAEMITDYYRRYQVPVMITETSAVGDDALRSRWLDASIGAVRRLRGQGVPVIGYTWFPMFTMIDWRYRWEQGPLEDYHLQLGLYTLNKSVVPRWNPTPLVSQWCDYVGNPMRSIGTLDVNVPASLVLHGEGVYG